MKYVFITLTCCFFALNLTAQNNGQIRGKLTDSAGRQTLPLATITVFSAKDTTIITYRLSDPQGEFKVPGIPLNVNCRVVITYSGYRVYRKEFELSGTQPQQDLGTIRLMPDPSSLDEVLVIAERPPVSVKKDTIEFNASAFKTLPTALVEDLLKKLPGVDLDKEGNITVNGRTVNRIMVDGRDFFGGDPKVASRNLPANMIDKVQVTDDKDQLAQDPFLDKSQLGQVINLKLKRSIKKGWFGKAYAGAGTDDRYEAGGIINLFRDTLQVSLIGYSNNVNRQAFSMNEIEKLGGFARTGISDMSNDNGALSVNGIPFGGGSQGITRSSAAGINVNQDFGKKLTVNLQYFYGETDNRQRQLTNIQQTINDTVLNTFSTTDRRATDYSNRLSANLRWRPDSFTTVRFEPRFIYKNARTNRELSSRTGSNFEELLNESQNDQEDSKEDISYRHELMYNRTFRKKDRNLIIGNGVDVRYDKPLQTTEARNTFYDGQSDNTILSQLRNRKIGNEQYMFGIGYIEPIAKKWRMRILQIVHVIRIEDRLNTFNRPTGSEKYDEPNPDLSNQIKRQGIKNATKASVRFIHKKWIITATAAYDAFRLDNIFLKSPTVKQHFDYLTPNIQIQFREFNLDYRVNIAEPQIQNLQPVADNTNPLYIVQGNPELIPTQSQNIQFTFRKFDTKRSINYSGVARANFDKDAVVFVRTIDGKGVQTTRPINADGNQRVYLSYNISKLYKYKSGWQLSLKTYASGGYNKQLVIVNDARNFQHSWNISPNIGAAFNWKDKVEISQSYGFGWTKAVNPHKAFTNNEVVTHSSSSEIVIRVPKRVVWESVVDYAYYPNVSAGIKKNFTRWNAAVNVLFLKDDQAQIKLSVFDLLNQNVNVNRQTRENLVQDTQIEVLQRYFMLTFTYNIRNIGGKVGGRQLFRF